MTFLGLGEATIMSEPIEPTTETEPTRRSLRLQDLVALTSGYALAALIFRGFWPSRANLAAIDLALLVFIYGWLGLAMSGPIVLLLDRRLPMPGIGAAGRWGRGAKRPPPGRNRETGANEMPGLHRSRYTRAELAWLAIGAYWLGMAIFLVPIRVHDTPIGLLLVLQTLAVLGVVVVVPRARPIGESGWTHRAAIAMLVSWPLAWAALIFLARSH